MGVVITLVFLSDDINQRYGAAIVAVGIVVMQWSGKADKDMESIAAHPNWFVEQMPGNFMGHVFDILHSLTQPDYWIAASFCHHCMLHAMASVRPC